MKLSKKEQQKLLDKADDNFTSIRDLINNETNDRIFKSKDIFLDVMDKIEEIKIIRKNTDIHIENYLFATLFYLSDIIELNIKFYNHDSKAY